MTQSLTKKDDNQKSEAFISRKGVWAVGFATKENQELSKIK